MADEKLIKINKQDFKNAYAVLDAVYDRFKKYRDDYIGERPAILSDWVGQARKPAEDELRFVEKDFKILVNNMESLKGGIKSTGIKMGQVDLDLAVPMME